MAAALGHHLVVHRGDPVQHALEVHVDAAVPRLGGGGMIGEEGERHDPRVVDEHVDGGVGVDGQGGEPGHLHPVGHVGAAMDRLASGRPDGGRDRFGPLGVDVGDDDARPLGADLLGHQSAEAAGGARDDDDFPPDVVAHCADRTSHRGGDLCCGRWSRRPHGAAPAGRAHYVAVLRLPAASLTAGDP